MPDLVPEGFLEKVLQWEKQAASGGSGEITVSPNDMKTLVSVVKLVTGLQAVFAGRSEGLTLTSLTEEEPYSPEETEWAKKIPLLSMQFSQQSFVFVKKLCAEGVSVYEGSFLVNGRIGNSLSSHDIAYVWELVEDEIGVIRKWKNFGDESFVLLEQLLDNVGLRLGSKIPPRIKAQLPGAVVPKK